jgi:hypothetical protein
VWVCFSRHLEVREERLEVIRLPVHDGCWSRRNRRRAVRWSLVCDAAQQSDSYSDLLLE